MSKTLEVLKWHAHAAIDKKAGEIRALYISDPTGQMAVYQTKLAEAKAYIAAYALDQDAVPGPHIAAESARRGLTALALATEVESLGSLWLDVLSPAIEAERVGGKEDVSNAEDQAAVDAEAASCLAALDAMKP